MASQFSKFASAMGGNKAGLSGIGNISDIGGGSTGGGSMGGGMPCEYELPMEFFILFVGTFLIYFIVFGFIPYEDILNKIVNVIMPIPKKIYSWATGLIPSSIKNRASKSTPSFVSKFFNTTLPNMIEAEKRKLLTPLQVKLQKLKDVESKKLQDKKDASGGDSSSLQNKLNTYYSNAKIKLLSMWETFRDKIIPAVIISLIYYVIWYLSFVIIPQILKYCINMAMQFKK
jgi:hypothetical protein